MKRITIVGAAVLGTLTASAVLATTAVAALPEVGRCVKVTSPHTGEYAGRGCSLADGGKGSYDWFSGAGEHKKFEGVVSEPVTLETVGKRLVTCTSTSRFSGEYTGPKEATLSVNLGECSYSRTGQSCQSSPLKAGVIEASGLEAKLGFIVGGEKPRVGWDLKQPSMVTPAVFTYECGKLPEATVSGSVAGSVIAQVTPIDKMTTETALRYRVTAGKQSPESFENEAKDILTTTFESGFPVKSVEAVEQTGLRTRVVGTSEEPLEVKAKCAGTGC